MRVAGFGIFALLLYLAVVVETSSSDGFHYVPQALPKFETKYGAFRFTEIDDRVSLEATAHALFLANLLGLKNQIDTTAVAGFLQSLRNPDHGYSQLPGYSSDLESVRQAVLTYQRLDQAVPDSANIATYIQSLLHKESNLFGNRVGDKGDIKSTAYAHQILFLLGLEPQFLQSVSTNAAQYLKSNLKETSEHRHFAFSEFGSIAGNYYGILLGSYVGYEFEDAEKWVSYIASFQSKEGGFYADDAKTVISLEATANALTSIHILATHSKSSANLLQRINVDKLLSFVQHISRNLKQASFAHLVNAIAKPTSEFQIDIQYETLEGSGITDTAIAQGAHVRPVVSTGNSALSVSVAIATGSINKNLKLMWRGNQYTTDEYFDTSNLLGTISFLYSIRSRAVETGDIVATVKETKNIGYNIAVVSQGSLGGQEINEGDNIGVGAHLSFALAFNNITNSNINSGDFDVVFTVLDSSLVSIHTQSVNGRGNSKPINFEYTLDSFNIPTGDLICRFQVKNANGVHSVKDIMYKFAGQMSATEIAFKGFSNKAPVYKIGDTVELSFVPATYIDGKKAQELKSDISGKDASSQRHFELDIKSPGGVTLQRVKGSPQKSEGKTRYVFKFPVTASLDSVGTKVLSFAYVDASGNVINLDMSPESAKHLFNENLQLTFSVDTELHVADLQHNPNNQDFYYGNLITLRFKVKDTVSSKFLSVGDSEFSNVYLDLKHADSGTNNLFVSTHQAAIFDGESFVIRWLINANAIRGAGILTLSAHDADSNSVPILKEGVKEEFAQNIEIGGDIEFDSNVKTTSHIDAKETALVAQFNLKCRDQPLRDARLKAFVSFVGEVYEEVLFQSSVATNDAGYEISFSLPHEAVRTGEYKIKVYRESRGDDSNPLLEISHRLQATENALPVRTEFVLLLAFVAAFAGLNMKKSQY